jgi:ABC-type dipeptide/oligopeptide/nickel transport system permease subunit
VTAPEATRSAALAPTSAASLPRGRTLWQDAWGRLAHNRLALAGLAFILVAIALAILAPLLARYDFAYQELGSRFQAPSRAHLLGTDHLGRDVLSRLLYGARISLTVGIAVQVLILLIGVPIGAVSGYFPAADRILMRIVDVLYALPDLLFVIIVMSYLRGVWGRAADLAPVRALQAADETTGGLLGIFIALGLTYWLTVARLVRAQVLALRGREFIEAARCLGATDRRILFHHLLPNTLGVIVVAATFGIPRAIILEAGLSFLGIGIKTPQPSWGIMIAEGITAMRSHPHLVVVPAVAIAVTVISFNFLGDGLRDALDPRMKDRH